MVVRGSYLTSSILAHACFHFARVFYCATAQIWGETAARDPASANYRECGLLRQL
jgi:hypothetical protein